MYLHVPLAALALALLSVPTNPTFAQQAAPYASQAMGLPAAAPVAGLPQADPAAGAAGEEPKKGWLMRTPVVDVPWPEVKMPKLSWKPLGGSDAQNNKPGPISRMSQATRNAAQKTRTAWNGAIDRMKVGPFKSQNSNEEKPSFFARWFGEEEEPQQAETVAEFIGQNRPEFR